MNMRNVVEDNLKLEYEHCPLCRGIGKIQETEICPVCKGEGFWEFYPDVNHKAVVALLQGDTRENPHVKELCDRRMAQVTPDNLEAVLKLLDRSGATDDDFNALQLAGATKWGWAWVHVNRFVIELCRLCGGEATEHRYALTKLAWKWLTEENQTKIDTSKKIDASIDKLNSALL
jgi:hypothetical protein